MRALFCGDRNWDDAQIIECVIRGLDRMTAELTIIHGNARGADSIAGLAAQNALAQQDVYPADWEKHGKRAGPIRNAQMLKQGKPDVVFAFHDFLAESKGTKDMVARARAADVPVYVIARAQ